MNAATPIRRGIVYHNDLIQGSDEWLAARCGLLTASEMKLIITPTLKTANSEKERAHLYELLAQRITRHVEPTYVGDDMLRGREDEIEAYAKYHETVSPLEAIGFITNDEWGFTLGYSPDGKLVNVNAGIEAKSRRQKYQVQTIVENIGVDKGKTIPADYVIQHQTGLLVSRWDWLDFISYSGGLPMAIIRVWPDPRIQNAIIETAGEFERRLSEKLAIYRDASRGLPMTERRIEQEMHL